MSQCPYCKENFQNAGLMFMHRNTCSRKPQQIKKSAKQPTTQNLKNKRTTVKIVEQQLGKSVKLKYVHHGYNSEGSQVSSSKTLKIGRNFNDVKSIESILYGPIIEGLRLGLESLSGLVFTINNDATEYNDINKLAIKLFQLGSTHHDIYMKHSLRDDALMPHDILVNYCRKVGGMSAIKTFIELLDVISLKWGFWFYHRTITPKSVHALNFNMMMDPLNHENGIAHESGVLRDRLIDHAGDDIYRNSLGKNKFSKQIFQQKLGERLNKLLRNFKAKVAQRNVTAKDVWTFHKDFTYLHPFTNGNGKTARAIMNAVFLKMGEFPFVVPHGSGFYKDNIKRGHYDVLENEVKLNSESTVQYLMTSEVLGAAIRTNVDNEVNGFKQIYKRALSPSQKIQIYQEHFKQYYKMIHVQMSGKIDQSYKRL